MDIDYTCYFDMIDYYWDQACKGNFKGNEHDTINYSIMHFMSYGIKMKPPRSKTLHLTHKKIRDRIKA